MGAFRTEYDLESIISKNVSTLADVIGECVLIGNQVSIPDKDGDRLITDSLMVSKSRSGIWYLIIVEYKRDKDKGIFTQAVGYRAAIEGNEIAQNQIKDLVSAKMGKEVANSIQWSKTKIICIAKEFDKHTARAVRDRRDVSLIAYSVNNTSKCLRITLSNARECVRVISQMPKGKFVQRILSGTSGSINGTLINTGTQISLQAGVTAARHLAVDNFSVNLDGNVSLARHKTTYSRNHKGNVCEKHPINVPDIRQYIKRKYHRSIPIMMTETEPGILTVTTS